MESGDVIEMHQRSIKNYSIKYNYFISDGDGTAYSVIFRECPIVLQFFCTISNV